MPVRTKIPVPIIQPIPNRVRSKVERHLFSPLAPALILFFLNSVKERNALMSF